MSAQTRLIQTEVRLFLREPMAVFWGLAFPSILLGILGAVPSFREPNDAFGGRTTVAVYVPICIAMTLSLLGLSMLPGVLATYRERGILRRLATTPVGRVRILVAQLTVYSAMAILATVLLITLGAIVFGVDLPRQPAGFLLAFLLALLALLGLGLLVTAVARSARASAAVGGLLFFPVMFFAGLYVPLDVMPSVIRRIGALTPLGAAVQALEQASAGAWPDAGHLLVLLVWALGCSGVAVRLFRWE